MWYTGRGHPEAETEERILLWGEISYRRMPQCKLCHSGKTRDIKPRENLAIITIASR